MPQQRTVPSPVPLSHRLRGFSRCEASIESLKSACRTKLKQIEIDTRVTADGQILVYHDVHLDTLSNQKGKVGDYSLLLDRPRYSANANLRIPLFSEFCEVFATHRSEDLFLYVDLKDVGFEDQHLKTIAAYGLTPYVRIVSWWPEVLRSVHRIDPCIPLMFSYVPMTGKARFLGCAKRLMHNDQLHRSVRWVLGCCLTRSRQATPHFHFYFDRENVSPLAEHPDRAIGSFPIHCLNSLPSGELLCCLQQSKGGINVPLASLTQWLVNRARLADLSVGVFSVGSPRQMLAVYRNYDPDIIFFDCGDAILELETLLAE